MIDPEVERQQRELCQRLEVDFVPAAEQSKIGIAANIREGILPINGLRHPPAGETSGWYIWAGEELSDAPDFFQPLHVEHLSDWCPQIQKYMGLPPGWRFLVAGEYEDIWYDKELLTV